MKPFLTCLTLTVALASASAFAQDATSNPPVTPGTNAPNPRRPDSAVQVPSTTSMVSRADERFMIEAAQGGLAEVEAGQLATQRATDSKVRQFAERMVQDHSKNNDELRDLAQRKGVMLPTELDDKHKTAKDQLAKLSGDAFDLAYLREMLSDHRKDVGEFRRHFESATDQDLKTWVGKTLPTLEDHRTMVQGLIFNTAGTSGRRPAAPAGDAPPPVAHDPNQGR